MFVLNLTDDYDNITFSNCTDNENNFDTILPTLRLSIPRGLSFLYLMILMIHIN